MIELPDKLHRKIKKLCAKGDKLADRRRYAKALDQYWEAWDLLPDPKTDWDASTWILAAVGDSNFLAGDYEAGRDNLSKAMQCPEAIGNPFIHLRLGQCQYELGNLERAADELARAFIPGGKGIFEEDDPKYLSFIKSKLDPPPDGWPEGW